MGYFEVGKIVNTQGINGEVRIISFSDDPLRFNTLKYIIISSDNGDKEYKIKSVRYHKQFVIARLEGINGINDAMALKGSLLKVPDKMGQKLEAGEYYIRDIYDMEVFEYNGNRLGIITDIIFTGANDVYVVQNDRIKVKDILIPAIKDCIVHVDTVNKKMVVKLPKGLVE